MKTIPLDVAEAEFLRLADAWDIDVDVTGMEEADLEGFEPLRKRFVKRLSQGRLVVSEDGEQLVQPLKYGDKIDLTYKVPTGAASYTLDKHKDGQNQRKVFSYLAAMSGQPEKYFSNMDARDEKVAKDVFLFFMG
jgi:hypothetical protein